MLARSARMLALLLLLVPDAASATVVNVELKFSPYVGTPAKEDKVESVAGVAAIFLNGVPYGEQPVQKESLPVLFKEREIGPSVWIPVDSLGPVVRRGKNTIRIEFVPVDEDVSYRGRLSWASVTDEENTAAEDGKTMATNQTGTGREEKSGKGRMIFEREIVADFAPDLPWHHYDGVKSLSDDDKKKLAALVMKRVGVFKPDFKGFYEILGRNERVELSKIKAAKCVDAAHAAGVKIDAPKAEELAFVTTGNPEVMITRKDGKLFRPANPESFAKIKGGEEIQMCAGIALSLVFPPQLVVVRDPEGAWSVAY